MSNTNPTKYEIIAIIDAYEGMLRLNWCPYLLDQRTKWVCELLKLEAR